MRQRRWLQARMLLKLRQASTKVGVKRPAQVALESPGEVWAAMFVVGRPREEGASCASLTANIESVSHHEIFATPSGERARTVVMLRDHQNAPGVEVGDRNSIRKVGDASDHCGASCAGQRRRVERFWPRIYDASAGLGQDVAQPLLPADLVVRLGPAST